MPNQKHYKAFISYSSIDEEFGQWLQKSLENYKIPKSLYTEYPHLPKKLYPIFRDKYELKSGDDLEIEIPKALKNSDALIIICSKNAVGSEWVDKEIRDFKKLYPKGKLLPIMIDGEKIVEDAFPEVLKYKFDEDGHPTNDKIDILASNVNIEADGRELAKLKLIAGVLGVPFGEFYDREKQEQNKRRVFLIGSLSIFSSLVGISSWKWIESDKQRYEVENLVYHKTMIQGIENRDYKGNTLKAKLLFAKAVKNSKDILQEKDAIIAYNFVNKNLTLHSIYELNNSINGLEVSRNNKQFISWNSNKIELGNIAPFEILSTFQDKKLINGAKFIKDESIISWSRDNVIHLWNIKNSEEKLNFLHDTLIKEVVISNNEKEFISWDKNNIIKLWNIKDNKNIFTEQFNEPILIVKFSKDNKSIFVYTKYIAYIINKKTLKKILILKYQHPIEKIYIHENNYKFIGWDNDNNIRIYNLKNKKERFILRNTSHVYGVSFNKNETKILIWSVDDEVKLLDLKERTNILIFKHKNINGASFNYNDTKIITWGSNNILKIWDSNNSRNLFSLKQNTSIDGISFSDDGKKIISWGGNFLEDKGEIRFWDFDTKEEVYIQNILNNKKTILKEKYSHDRMLRVEFDMSNIRIWNNQTKQEVLQFKADNFINGVVFSKNNKQIFLFTGNVIEKEGQIIPLDIESKRKIFTLIHKASVDGVKLIDNEDKLISWSNDIFENKSEICIWNKKNGKKIFNIKHNNYINELIYTKHKQIIISGLDNTYIIWNNKGEKIVVYTNYLKKHTKSYNLYKKRKLSKRYYPLEAQVETGVYLTPSGEVIALTKDEWQQKKKKYEQILKESNP